MTGFSEARIYFQDTWSWPDYTFFLFPKLSRMTDTVRENFPSFYAFRIWQFLLERKMSYVEREFIYPLFSARPERFRPALLIKYLSSPQTIMWPVTRVNEYIVIILLMAGWSPEVFMHFFGLQNPDLEQVPYLAFVAVLSHKGSGPKWIYSPDNLPFGK